MKLQIILINNSNQKGFLLFEIIITISLFTLFTISSFVLSSSMNIFKNKLLMQLYSFNEKVISMNKIIDTNSYSVNNLNNEYTNEYIKYDNDSKVYNINPFTIVKSDYANAWGMSNCFTKIDFNKDNIRLNNNGLFLGIGNNSTDIKVNNSIAYISTDSNISSQYDFFILDLNNKVNPIILSSINTGPGISSIAIAGPYAYLANTSTISQLQILDIHNRNSPIVISQLKLPTISTTSIPKANKVYYKNGYIYLGTSKWDGAEFNIINVADPYNPILEGNFETNTLINDIYIINNKAYIATSDIYQMRVLDIKNKDNPILIDTFTTSGWEVQQGKVIHYFQDNLGLARTVGGVNRINNHEIFIFSATSTLNQNYISKDIPGGVYGLIIRDFENYLITHSLNSEFQIWNRDFSEMKYSLALGFLPVSMTCDRSTLYFVTGNDRGFSILTL